MSAHRANGEQTDFVALLRARKAFGPICGWCEADAREYEQEYCVDHNAGSDFLHFADSARWSCRAGRHITRERFEHCHRYPGNLHPRPTTGVA